MAEHLKVKDMIVLKWNLTKDNLANLTTKLRSLDWTKHWRVTVVESKANRSLEQNLRLWELYTSIGNHLGIEKDKIHDLMGYKFLRYQTEIAGMPVELVKSTTKLDTQAMSEYQHQVEIWAQTMGWEWDL
ncbi:hypothetical protein UFOVP770_41 [uncultured Caudovirales phage]|uniref:Recombinase NinB n=1 Tax=uncultured Caudovirales phage TaxID=2100421 RepID=A0A6J5NW84_9CAUD|nr:hypothetical protein UFOVP770_41 [uncultured Caudovirales phage]